MAEAWHQIWQGDVLDGLRRFDDGLVHACVTSPPYWALRDYGIEPTDWPEVRYRPMPGVDSEIVVPPTTACLGLEETPEAFVGHLLLVFREVWRVLRDDGILWINIADTYAATTKGSSGRGDKQVSNSGTLLSDRSARIPSGLKSKDLVGIPFRLAFAMQADGWYLRSDVVWGKPAPMPESVRDRPTRSHEYVFLFAKRPNYFYDMEAVKEADRGRPAGNRDGFKSQQGRAAFQAKSGGADSDGWVPNTGRNVRDVWRDEPEDLSVWTLHPTPLKAAHYATMPTTLAERCIKAGTSERGVCPECGAPWRRLVDREPQERTRASGWNSTDEGRRGRAGLTVITTIGWQPTCVHADHEPVPAIVLDPFSGAGTTALVARRLGRIGLGIEKNPDYIDIAERRITAEFGKDTAA